MRRSASGDGTLPLWASPANRAQPEPGGLSAWAPEAWPVAPDWRPVVDAFLGSPVGRQLAKFLHQRLRDGAVVYPSQPLRALACTPLATTRVVILGQDPYHGPGQAEGLAFSVPPGVKPPPSLRNIHQELAREHGVPPSPQGHLGGWAAQGVLLLNTTLTVEAGQAGSHARRGWEVLTDALIDACSAHPEPKVFLLWGAHAQSKRARIDETHHRVLCANHPSPLSARRPPVPFIGCGHFAAANAWLEEKHKKKIDWLCGL